MKLAVRALVGFLAAALATVLAMTTAQAAPAPYTIQLVACDVVGGDTDDRVEARLNGTTASSPWLVLEHEGDHDQEYIRSYTFVLPAPLGPIQSVDIAFDYHGDAWCLAEVIVRGPDGVTVHPYHNWVRRKHTKSFPLRLPAA